MEVKATTDERATSLTSDAHALSLQPHLSPTPPPPAPRSLCNRALSIGNHMRPSTIKD